MDSYGGNLVNKPEMVVINKIDAIEAEELKSRLNDFKKSFGRKKKPIINLVSAAGRLGITELISAIEKEFLRIEEK